MNNNEKLEKVIELLEELKNEQDVKVDKICFTSDGKIITYVGNYNHTKEILKSLYDYENIKELDSMKFADNITIPIRIGGNDGNTTAHNLRIILHYFLSKGYRIKEQNELSYPIELEKIK